jgi:hypothetical protein
MAEVPTRTLRDYINSLPSGGVSGVIDQNLVIRNDLVTSQMGLPTGGLTGQNLVKLSDADFSVGWEAAGAGDMLKVMYDPQSIEADAFARENHTGTQPVATITGLAPIATSGSYADLSGTPTYLPPRSVSAASGPTLTPNVDSYDVVAMTAQAQALAIAAPTGTPLDGQELTVRIRDNGTSRALSWDGAYSGYTSDLPASTVVNMTMLYRFMFNSSTNKWDLLTGNPVPGKWG